MSIHVNANIKYIDKNCLSLDLSPQSHGFEHLLTFHNLRKLGLFCESEPSSSAANQRLVSQLGKLGSEVANIARSSPFRSLSKRLALVGCADLVAIYEY